MKKHIILLLILVVSIRSMAQDSLKVKAKKNLLPHYAIFQFAGNMGLASLGTGYLFNKRRMGLGLQVGYLPESIGGAKMTTLTLKYIYSPWEINHHNFYIVPIDIGINLTNTYSDLIERKWASHYPRGYYPIIPSLNFGFFVGSSIYYKVNKKKESKSRFGLFYEFVITSRLTELWYDNPEVVRFQNLWNLSLGFKYRFR